jgi:ankyrin repeat protein
MRSEPRVLCRHLATLHDKVKAIELLLSAGADVNSMPSGGGPTPLHLAARKPSEAGLALLLRANAQLGGKMAGTGESALHLCAGDAQCCALLLHEGAAIDERDAMGCTPLQHAVTAVSPVVATRALLNAGAEANTIASHSSTA